MSESQKCQNFPVVAVRGGLAPLTLIWLVLTQANTTHPKHAPWSLIWSNLKTDLISVIQHDIYSDFSLLWITIVAELQWTYMESFICMDIIVIVSIIKVIARENSSTHDRISAKPFLCLLPPLTQWIQNFFQRLLYLLGPALGKFFLMLWARFLFLFWLLNVFLTFMLASLLLFDNMGWRPLGCALVDFMPDFLLEIAVGCTLILESGAPNVTFRKISVRKTIGDLEFSEHFL